MMKNEMVYKVLWVDDQEEIVESTKLDADEYGIELDHYSNWEDAEVALRKSFEDYTAIILDAFCRIKPFEDTKEEFVGAVLPSLARIFGEKNKFIPWYILSAGTMNYFSHTVQSAEYQHQTEEWGQMLYIKDATDENPRNSRFLYENIRKVGKARANNVVLFRHKEVFSYLGSEKLIDERARKTMLKMLSALYFPEDNVKYEFSGNPLRKVLEYIFRSARKQGFLPEECFSNNKVILEYSRLFMEGVNVYYEKKDKKKYVRWGNEGELNDGRGGECIFTKQIADIVRTILIFTNDESHTSEDDLWVLEEDKKEYFFGYVLMMCHVIKWYGRFVADNPDVDRNRKMQKRIEVPLDGTIIMKNRKDEKPEIIKAKNTFLTSPLPKDDIKGKKYLIMNDGKTYYCGSCKLDDSVPYRSGQVVLEVIIENQGLDKEKYPYIATKVSQVK